MIEASDDVPQIDVCEVVHVAPGGECERASGTMNAIFIRSSPNEFGQYSLTAPRDRQYQSLGILSQRGVPVEVITRNDFVVSLSRIPFGYSTE